MRNFYVQIIVKKNNTFKSLYIKTDVKNGLLFIFPHFLFNFVVRIARYGETGPVHGFLDVLTVSK